MHAAPCLGGSAVGPYSLDASRVVIRQETARTSPEADAIMTACEIGLSTGCFYDAPIGDVLGPIRDAGFEAIEVCSARGHLDYRDAVSVRRAASEVRRLDFRPYSFHAPFAPDIDITSADDGVRRASQAEIVRAAEAASELEVEHFVIHPGPERSALSDCDRLQGMERAVQVLDHVDRRCGNLGVKLVLENMLPHLFSGHVQDLMWIIGALEATDIGVCLDTGHALLSGEIDTVVEKLANHLWMVHANDNRGSRDDHLAPGDGLIDWVALTRRLSRASSCRMFVLEIHGSDADPSITLARARRGRAHLEHAIALTMNKADSSPPDDDAQSAGSRLSSLPNLPGT